MVKKGIHINFLLKSTPLKALRMAIVSQTYAQLLNLFCKKKYFTNFLIKKSEIFSKPSETLGKVLIIELDIRVLDGQSWLKP